MKRGEKLGDEMGEKDSVQCAQRTVYGVYSVHYVQCTLCSLCIVCTDYRVYNVHQYSGMSALQSTVGVSLLVCLAIIHWVTLEYTSIHSTKTHYTTIDFPKLKLPTPQCTSIHFPTPRSLHLTTLQYFCCYFYLFLSLAKPVIQVTSREQYNTLLTYTTLHTVGSPI